MHALPLMVTAICVVAIAYRYYSAFLAAKVLCLGVYFFGMSHSRLAARSTYAVVAGLYLALSPKFLTTFSLNSVGQYMDVLALGGAALALLASVLDGDEADRTGVETGRPKANPRWRLSCFGIGYLLGAALWQQPVALAYLGAVLAALALRRATWREPAFLLLPLGLAVGVLPVLIWNAQNGWGSGDILGRHPQELLAQAEALPVLVARTATRAFPYPFLSASFSPHFLRRHVPLFRVRST